MKAWKEKLRAAAERGDRDAKRAIAKMDRSTTYAAGAAKGLELAARLDRLERDRAASERKPTPPTESEGLTRMRARERVGAEPGIVHAVEHGARVLRCHQTLSRAEAKKILERNGASR